MDRALNKIRFVFIIIALLMMIAPAVTINTKLDVRSELDNRALAEFPQLPESGLLDDNFIAGVNDYVEDRIGFREQALAIYQIANDRLFHYLVHPLYEYGKDGWIMTKDWDPIQTYHLDLEDGFEDRFAVFMKDAQGIAADNGADFMFLLIPNKETVYPEYMSDGYNIKNQESKSEKILQSLDSEGVPYLYLLPKFQELKEHVQLYNIKDDPGHWNENGMFYGNVELVNYLRENFVGYLEPLTLEQFSVTSEKTEYLYQSSIRIDEYVPRYSICESGEANPTIPFWENEFGEKYIEYNRLPILIENESDNDKPKVLIIHDSYFNSEAYFIGNLFSSVCLLHSSEIKNYKKTIELFKPDIVVIEAAERVIGPEQNFYNDAVLQTGL